MNRREATAIAEDLRTVRTAGAQSYERLRRIWQRVGCLMASIQKTWPMERAKERANAGGSDRGGRGLKMTW